MEKLEGMQEEKREIKVQMCAVWFTVVAKCMLELYFMIALIYGYTKEDHISDDHYYI